MIKLFQKILLLIAVFTVTAHSIFPHIHLDDIMAIVEDHHHDEQSMGAHHHDDDNNNDDHHNLFSFAQLDDDFIPAKGHPKSFEISEEDLPVLIASFLPGIFPVNTKPHFGWHIEYPPQDDQLYDLPSRAPPAII